MWTKERPTIEGFYWLKNFKLTRASIYPEQDPDPTLVVVKVQRSGKHPDNPLEALWPGDDMEEYLKDFEGEWDGPIQPYSVAPMIVLRVIYGDVLFDWRVIQPQTLRHLPTFSLAFAAVQDKVEEGLKALYESMKKASLTRSDSPDSE